jgi:hypothetical protein
MPFEARCSHLHSKKNEPPHDIIFLGDMGEQLSDRQNLWAPSEWAMGAKLAELNMSAPKIRDILEGIPRCHARTSLISETWHGAFASRQVRVLKRRTHTLSISRLLYPPKAPMPAGRR